MTQNAQLSTTEFLHLTVVLVSIILAVTLRFALTTDKLHWERYAHLVYKLYFVTMPQLGT